MLRGRQDVQTFLGDLDDQREAALDVHTKGRKIDINISTPSRTDRECKDFTMTQ